MGTSNRNIAKNTAFLYTGTLVNLLISLYTSRVVLNTLGVVDYGIYSVVGSVISMITIINMLMISSTSRFLCIEIGRKDDKRLADTFNSAMIGQVILALIVVVLLETGGIYMLNHKMVIPEERMFAAHVVFQLSILSMFINTTQQPYNATITAHEHFGIYTFMDILNTTLKLVIVFLLVFYDFDKLILYSILLLAVTTLMSIIYRIYCIRHFQECHLSLRVNRDILFSMLKYSFWSMMGSTAKTYSIQGSNMILNMFFGPVLNAANGIAMTVEGAIVGFSFNVITAFRFQIVKAYAAQEFQRMCQLIYQAAQYSTALLLLVAIPLLFEIRYVLGLWLGQFPDYTVAFIRLLLIASVIRINVSLISISIGATPNVRNLNIVNSLLLFLQLPVVYIIFLSGNSPVYLYLISITIYSVSLLCDFFILKGLIPLFSLTIYLYNCIIRILPVLVISCSLLYFMQTILAEGFIRLVILCVVNTLVFGLYFYLWVLNKQQRLQINTKVIQWLDSFKRSNL